MQALRVYHDTHKRWPALGNALKYAIARLNQSPSPTPGKLYSYRFHSGGVMDPTQRLYRHCPV